MVYSRERKITLFHWIHIFLEGLHPVLQPTNQQGTFTFQMLWLGCRLNIIKMATEYLKTIRKTTLLHLVTKKEPINCLWQKQHLDTF
jgi:hypothetical protein